MRISQAAITMPLVVLLGCVTAPVDPAEMPGDALPAVDSHSAIAEELDTVSRELAAEREHAMELAAELQDARSANEALISQIDRLNREREITLTSMTQASAEVGVTRQELDKATRDIALIRGEISRLVSEIANLDQAHAGQIDEFSERLDQMLNQYDSGAPPETGGSTPIGRSSVPRFDQ